MNRTQGRYQGGYVEKRGRVWYLQFRDGSGEKRRTRIGNISDFPTKSTAERAAAGIRERINDPFASAVGPKTMRDVVARYMAEEMPTGYATSKAYRGQLSNYILPKWGDRQIQGIKAHEIRAWLRGLGCLDGKPASDKYKKHMRGLLGSLFRYAALWEWYSGENPLRLFRLESNSRQAYKPRVLTPEEFGRFLKFVEEPFRSMVLLCGCLGLRCSEMIGLQWGDIDWRRKTLTVSRGVVNGYLGDVKTMQSARPMPIADEVVQLFEVMRAQAGQPQSGDWLFPSAYRASKPLNAYKIQARHLNRAALAAGLGPTLGWHTLRHSYRSWLDRSGAPVGVQRDLMRHSDIRTTMNVYGDSFIDNLRDVQGGVAKMVLQ